MQNMGTYEEERGSPRKPAASKLAVHILKDREDFYWGFPCRDIRSLPRREIGRI